MQSTGKNNQKYKTVPTADDITPNLDRLPKVTLRLWLPGQRGINAGTCVALERPPMVHPAFVAAELARPPRRPVLQLLTAPPTVDLPMDDGLVSLHNASPCPTIPNVL